MRVFMKVRVWKLLGLVFITTFAFSAISSVHAIPTLAVSSTIPKISGAMAYDYSNGEIFVVGYSGISAVSDGTNQVVATVTIAGYPGFLTEMTYDSGQHEIFLSSGSGTAQGIPPAVWVLSGSTNRVVANVTSGSWWLPWGVAYDSAKGEIFLADAGNGQNVFGGVYVISDSTNTVTAFVGVGIFPREMAYDSGKGEIFVANSGPGISVISDSTNTVVATINGVTASGLVYDSSKGEIFAANGYNGVSVISDSSNAVVANVTGLSGVQGIAYDSAKGEIFVGNSVISDSNNAVVAQVPNSLGSVVYDSGKGEIIGSTPAALDIFSDSSSASTIATSSATATSQSPTTTQSATSSQASSTSLPASYLVLVAVQVGVVLSLSLIAQKRDRRRGTTE